MKLPAVCVLLIYYSCFFFFFPVMPQAIKTKHPGRIGLNLNKFSFGTLKVTIILKAAVTLSQIVARKQ